MSSEKNYLYSDVVIVGGGLAGLSAAIVLRAKRPDLQVCVLDKGRSAGSHALSGCVLEPGALAALAGYVSDEALRKKIMAEAELRVVRDQTLVMVGRRLRLPISPLIRIGKMLGLGFGQMSHQGDAIVSVARLTRLLAEAAQKMGAEVYYGFSVESPLTNADGSVCALRLREVGRNREGLPQPNHTPAEDLEARYVIMAEGPDGTVTSQLISKLGLVRQREQLYSLGVKEIFRLPHEEWIKFGAGRVIHSMGYPIWGLWRRPDMFGGGLVYSLPDNQIAVGMIVGLDWRYCDFNPQEALQQYKETPLVADILKNATRAEAGAKMIPEGGYYAIPRHSTSGTIGYRNTVLTGDCAGFVNMFKIKGAHNAIYSGILAAQAVAESQSPAETAEIYTRLIKQSPIEKEMRGARSFRQLVAKLGPLFGFPLTPVSNLLPLCNPEPDYRSMRSQHYPWRTSREYDRATFAALAGTHHREDQPCHLRIINPEICARECAPKYGEPCITFCPAGVYEQVGGVAAAANPSNCLHCKTCQRKCPFDNIRWLVPEGGGGPLYRSM